MRKHIIDMNCVFDVVVCVDSAVKVDMVPAIMAFDNCRTLLGGPQVISRVSTNIHWQVDIGSCSRSCRAHSRSDVLSTHNWCSHQIDSRHQAASPRDEIDRGIFFQVDHDP